MRQNVLVLSTARHTSVEYWLGLPLRELEKWEDAHIQLRNKERPPKNGGA